MHPVTAVAADNWDIDLKFNAAVGSGLDKPGLD